MAPWRKRLDSLLHLRFLTHLSWANATFDELLFSTSEGAEVEGGRSETKNGAPQWLGPPKRGVVWFLGFTNLGWWWIPRKNQRFVQVFGRSTKTGVKYGRDSNCVFKIDCFPGVMFKLTIPNERKKRHHFHVSNLTVFLTEKPTTAKGLVLVRRPWRIQQAGPLSFPSSLLQWLWFRPPEIHPVFFFFGPFGGEENSRRHFSDTCFKDV